METDQLLSATGDELSRLLGEVLQPEKCGKHNWSQLIGEKTLGYRWRCLTCGHEAETNNPNFKCEKAVAEIPLNDWNVAMKWRDWAVAEYGRVQFCRLLDKAMREVTNNCHMELKRACDAQPEHYLRAAALCKLS